MVGRKRIKIKHRWGNVSILCIYYIEYKLINLKKIS